MTVHVYVMFVVFKLLNNGLFKRKFFKYVCKNRILSSVDYIY